LSRRLGQTLSIPHTLICFKDRPRLSRHQELPAPFLKFRSSQPEDTHNTRFQWLGRFQAQTHSTTQMAPQSRVNVFRLTTLSEIRLILMPLHRRPWEAGSHHYPHNKTNTLLLYRNRSISQMCKISLRVTEHSHLLWGCQLLMTFHLIPGESKRLQ
jgi:hypothetical protein